MINLTQNLDPEQVSEIRIRLQNVGLRSTTARIVVINVLMEADKPLTRADVVSRLSVLGFDNSTLYRILTDLSNTKLIYEIHEPGAPQKYYIENED